MAGSAAPHQTPLMQPRLRLVDDLEHLREGRTVGTPDLPVETDLGGPARVYGSRNPRPLLALAALAMGSSAPLASPSAAPVAALLGRLHTTTCGSKKRSWASRSSRGAWRTSRCGLSFLKARAMSIL